MRRAVDRFTSFVRAFAARDPADCSAYNAICCLTLCCRAGLLESAVVPNAIFAVYRRGWAETRNQAPGVTYSTLRSRS